MNTELVNTGVINPGAGGIGNLTIDGDLNQNSAGTVNFELASMSSFNQLTIVDNATWGGDIGVWNLGYTPTLGDRFVVATLDARLANSTFTNVITHGFGAGVNFSVTYNEHDVTLAVTAVPETEPICLISRGTWVDGRNGAPEKGNFLKDCFIENSPGRNLRRAIFLMKVEKAG